jgi:hypothetical protein
MASPFSSDSIASCESKWLLPRAPFGGEVTEWKEVEKVVNYGDMEKMEVMGGG